jgi:antitoxin ParD1/3/4
MAPAGLRLLEECEARLSALQAAVVEGERSGKPEPFDFDDFLEDKRRTATIR